MSLTKLIHDAKTNKSVSVPLTPEELEDLENIKAEAEKREAEQQAKIAARQAALAKLAELGLTEEEIKAIAG